MTTGLMTLRGQFLLSQRWRGSIMRGRSNCLLSTVWVSPDFASTLGIRRKDGRYQRDWQGSKNTTGKEMCAISPRGAWIERTKAISAHIDHKWAFWKYFLWDALLLYFSWIPTFFPNKLRILNTTKHVIKTSNFNQQGAVFVSSTAIDDKEPSLLFFSLSPAAPSGRIFDFTSLHCTLL